MEERRIAPPFVKPASLIISTISKPDFFHGILASVHPETSEDASWSFQFINEQFAARSRKSRDYAEAYFTYAAQEIPKIHVGIAAKGHLWMETSPEISRLYLQKGKGIC
jgi:hypothetical protein